MKYQIIETDIYGEIPSNPDEWCYLNHSCLSSFSFGSPDMAWQADSRLEAEGMIGRMEQAGKSRHCAVVAV